VWDFLKTYPALAFAIGSLIGALSSLIITFWGSIHGWFITNLSIALELRRTSHNLVTTIKLKKGAMNALTLQYLKVELFSLSHKDLLDRLAQWHSLPETTHGERRTHGVWVPQTVNHSINAGGVLHDEQYILGIWTPEHGRAENLAPLEETQYASYSTISSDGIYEITVTLMGVRYTSRFARIIFELWSWCTRLKKYIPQNAYYTASAISTPADTIRFQNQASEGITIP
jgi:hypothetical protein